MSRIPQTFQRLRAEGRTALMPYLTIGHPERDSTQTLVPAVVESGADLLELGVPFSDPLADGATVQASTQQALANGVNLRFCLETVRLLRERGIETPFAFMGYYNPIYQMGLERFAAAAQEAGVDGVIVPDLPPEEAVALDEALRQRDLDYIYLLAPTSDESRMRLVAERARGFIYLVSLMGVTGARAELPAELPAFIQRVREYTRGEIPLAVGFGIGTPEAARTVGALADGVIVGSALVKRVADPATAEHEARQFVRSLREGLDQEAKVQG
ncbi:MAG TPA: tryptophan synthase subunit alpha [Ardenticatenaceae bacterium]|jgi:tryptophan synthase alpha chain